MVGINASTVFDWFKSIKMASEIRRARNEKQECVISGNTELKQNPINDPSSKVNAVSKQPK